MALKKKILYSLLLTAGFGFSAFILSQLFLPPHTKVLPLETQSATVPNVTARVGEYQIGLLSGWASPYAEVNLIGQGTNRKTVADQNGYFEFSLIPVKKSYGELCLTSIDINQIPTFPVCLSPIPPQQDVQVRGILLPPTLTLAKGKITTGESTKAFGMTFPNSQLDVYLFENGQGFWQTLISPVFAAGLPKYEITSNENGYFEFSLPGTKPAKNRIFTNSLFESSIFPNGQQIPLSFSPKSNILALTILNTFWYWWLVLLAFFILVLLVLFTRRKKDHQLIVYEPFCETRTPQS